MSFLRRWWEWRKPSAMCQCGHIRSRHWPRWPRWCGGVFLADTGTAVGVCECPAFRWIGH